jgi:hypothetical protein
MKIKRRQFRGSDSAILSLVQGQTFGEIVARNSITVSARRRVSPLLRILPRDGSLHYEVAKAARDTGFWEYVFYVLLGLSGVATIVAAFISL